MNCIIQNNWELFNPLFFVPKQVYGEAVWTANIHIHGKHVRKLFDKWASKSME